MQNRPVRKSEECGKGLLEKDMISAEGSIEEREEDRKASKRKRIGPKRPVGKK